MASLIGGVEDFVVEDGEVEGESESDGVRGGQTGVGDLRGILIGVQGVGGRLLARVASLELSEVTVVVTLHLVVEHLGLIRGRVGDEVVLNDKQDVLTDAFQLNLDGALVVHDLREFVRFALGLDGRHHSPGRTAGTDYVLVSHREQVSLLHSELVGLARHVLHVRHHLIKALSLLGQLGHEHIAISVHCDVCAC